MIISGAVGTCKAVISEASDDSNQSLGVALLGTSFGLGIILGPAVSGFISDPIGQYNLTIDSEYCIISVHVHHYVYVHL